MAGEVQIIGIYTTRFAAHFRLSLTRTHYSCAMIDVTCPYPTERSKERIVISMRCFPQLY